MEKIIIPNSERINYIRLNKDLVNDYLNMVNDSETYSFISREPRTFIYEEEEKWVEEKLNDNSKIFSMLEKGTNKFIGNIEVSDPNNEIGICITKDMQDKHYGKEAIKTIIDYCFNTLNFDVVTLKVHQDNPRAIKCYKNAGFTEYNRDEQDIFMHIKRNKMEKFHLEEPSIKRKQEAIEYIKEHIKYNSNINGSGGLDSKYENYEEWLEYLELNKNSDTCQEGKCPGVEYFLIRESDDKLIGMINLRWNLTKDMLQHGGNIGYGIRPTERRKGYAKIQLYLCLLKAKELGLDKVLLTAYDNNIGSVKTILALGGVLENKVEDNLGRYWINVEDSINKNKDVYKGE